MLDQEARRLSIETKEKNRAEIEDFISKNTVRSNYIKLIPRLYQHLMYNVFSSKKGYAKAVKAKCLDCSCFQKNEIKDCSVEICPLWNVRPYQSEK